MPLQPIPPLTTLFPPGPLRSWDDIDTHMGHEFHTLDDHVVHRGEPIRKSWIPAMPTILNPLQVVAGLCIPSTSWGSSLANLLTKACWDAFRKPVISAQNHVCAHCGQRRKILECHELWNYEVESSIHTPGVQTLKGIVALCGDCHKMHHLGFANMQGRLDEILTRLMWINRWDQATTLHYYDAYGDYFERMSQYVWMVDLSEWTATVPELVIKTPWELHPDDPHYLRAPNKYPNHRSGSWHVTRILGMPWRLAK
ncbi:hypothetical protein A4U49_04410 [Acidithiobacillus ferrivorans]|uniref:hypothetical protein n=1 Tax=Acidithiobacillus ferrivorans TaxID=160808 RepID=UPI00089371C5|nr:hypothetical protein [Acidithiobacillus ferrivorans]OFA17030.1 hypothetical protein A4U49_04410 [Acidithiobacillus ferrivorans]